MPVYLLYGFRWPRAGFTGIRVYIVLHNLEDATAEYLQQPLTTQLLLDSFKKTEPGIVSRLPDMRFIEQYDPEDTSEEAVSKTHAYVAGKVITMPEVGSPGACLSFDAEELVKSSGLEQDAMDALTEMRDKYAAGEKIGWYIVYNGDPDRYFPPDEEDEEDYSFDEEDEDDQDDGQMNGVENGNGTASRPPSTPTSLLTRFFTKKAA
ncbi:uncharacterized protein LDX57_004077 [Aspergillus melleus]|uniref:uncharacterized protein n=1 Tax=Aspergillus melleus TaxID=138277 RepID=UPI001E8CAB57|nr:uncharacterized protein LDX57_004077 [Aspergillus melleus]KAH8426334.1 hypothetical protein LDX57_004077 [Aspergillus melleus]